MTAPVPSPKGFKFDSFELDLHADELRMNGRPIKLQLQPFRVLALLVGRAGQVVSRKEICDRIWGSDTFVDYEQGLNYCIRQVRTALGEGVNGTKYVETCPRRGYRFLRPVVVSGAAPHEQPERVMLAVLSLENVSRNSDEEYLADGLTDELIAELGRLAPQSLGLIARTSSMRYKGSGRTIEEIGRDLGVHYVVEGSVLRNGRQLRVRVRLVRVEDQSQVWSHRYEYPIQDVLRLQEELAVAIAREVQVKLIPSSRESRLAQPVDPQVYEAVLKGRFLWNYRRSREGLYKALEYFARAVELGPKYAPGFSGIADTYLVLLDSQAIGPNEALALSTAAAINALQIDEGSAEAHTSLAHARFHAWDWTAAESGFARAIQLRPTYAPAHYYYANLLLSRRRFEGAIVEAQEALTLDPVSVEAMVNLALVFCNAGHIDDALRTLQDALRLDPGSERASEKMGRVLFLAGQAADAIDLLEGAVPPTRRSSTYLSSLGYSYGVSGNLDAARDALRELEIRARQQYVAGSDFALICTGLGDIEAAVRWLGQSFDQRDSILPFIHIDARFKTLRSHPQFETLVRKLGLPF